MTEDLDFRKRAEEIAQQNAASSRSVQEPLPPETAQRVLHELKVHQVELELQNEELRRTQWELEATRARYFDLYDMAPVGYITVSAQGLILEANLTVANLLGVARGVLVTSPISRFIDPEDQDLFYLHRKQLFESGEPQAWDLRMVPKNGTPFWANLQATSVQNGKDAPTCRIVLSDITAKIRLAQGQQFLARAEWLTTGEDFFLALARFLAQHLGMDYVCIDRLAGDCLSAETLAIWFDGQFEDNVSYTLKDTPCGEVVGQTVCCFPSGVRHRFPKDQVLQDMAAESYLGVTLWGAGGQPIGLIALIARHPVVDARLAESTLALVGLRAAGELERRQAEEALRSSNELFSLYMRHSPAYTYIKEVTPAESRVLQASGNFAQMVGIPGMDMVGKTMAELFPTEFAAKITADDWDVVSKGEVVKLDEELNGQHYITTKFPLQQTGSRKLLGGYTVDITDRKLAEKALKTSEERYRSILATTLDGFLIVGEEGAIEQVNETYCRMSGYSAQELLTMRITDLEAVEDSAETSTHIAKILAIGQDRFESRHRRKDGSVFDVENSVQRIAGMTLKMVAFLRDVTERKVAEAALRESEFFFKESQRAATIGSYRADFSKDCWVSSEILDEIFGIDPSHDRSIPGWLAIIHPDDRDMMDRYIREEVIGLGRPFNKEYRIVRKSDGAIRWVQGMGEVGFDPTAAALTLTGTIMDITERKETDFALQESKALTAAVIDNAPLMIFLKEAADLKFVLFNRAGEELLGVDREGLFGKNDLDLFPPEQAAHFMADDRKVLEGTLGLLDIPEEAILTAKKGQRILHTRKVCLRGTDGATKYLLGISEDITDRKQAEEGKAKLQAQLQQAQKMESLGSLAGGVAHDMNNVLGAILGMASANLAGQAEGSRAHQAFQTIIKAAERGGKMVKGLLAFARQTPAEALELDMNAVLQEEANLLERTTLARIRLEMDLAHDLRPIRGDASALTHAVLNLCVNAVDALPENGTLTLRTRNVDNDWIEVIVEDNGTGMPKEILDKAMDPFFTTKEVGKGTGLGLSMAYSTVKAHQGQMEILSEPGQGTRIMMRFPACETLPLAHEPVVLPQSDSPRTALTLLVVDDDELIQSTMQALLEILGHRATAVSSGEQALAKLEAGFHPDIVVLDMNMPGLGGAGTLPRLRALRPTLPVLLATGRVDQFASDLVAAYPFVALLSKPYSIGELQQRLQAISGG